MTLKTALASALAPVLAVMITEFGETAKLRRPDADEAADGSSVSTLNRVAGAEDPIGLLPVSRSAFQVVQDWGRDREVALEAYILDTVPVTEGDMVRLQSGAFASRWFVAWRSMREPAGGVNLWAFSDAGEGDRLDAMDQGL